MDVPILPPLPDDEEDVRWALSTATALWGRGERAEALKWLRRAAETASDANADARALALFKAAADISTRISMMPPPASEAPAASAATVPAPFLDGGPASRPGSAPAPPPHRPGSAPAPPPHRPASAPAPPPPPSKPGGLGLRSGAVSSVPHPLGATLPSAVARHASQRGVVGRSAPPGPPPSRPRGIPSPTEIASLEGAIGRAVQNTPTADLEGLARTLRHEPASAQRAPVASLENVARSLKRAPIVRERVTAPGARPEVHNGDARTLPVGRRRSGELAQVRTPEAERERAREAAGGGSIEDEVTQQRSVSSILGEARSRYDDLEEVTSVLQGKPVDEELEDQLDRAMDAMAAAGPATELDPNTPEDRTEPGFAWSHATYDGTGDALPETPGRPTPTEVGSPYGVAIGSVAVPSTERAVPLPVLSAVRVAVLPGSAPGEARLIVLDGVGTPPAGAVHAVLLPLSVLDNAAIVRLLGG